MTEAEIAAIANSLIPAHRATIRMAPGYVAWNTAGSTRKKLRALGLLEDNPPGTRRLSPLGLAVRAHLQQQDTPS